MYIEGDLIMTNDTCNSYPRGIVCRYKTYNTYHKNTIHIVNVIDNPRESLILEENEISPILLTDRILIDNGWEIEDDDETYTNSEGIILSQADKNSFVFIIVGKVLTQLHYVHELQHLLFGLKINQNIKIK